jgi:uncharacterized protein YegP (UPF0339 family)
MTDGPREHDVVEVYRDAKGEWRWRRQAANGEMIAASGEGYESKSYAVEIARSVNMIAPVVIDP